MYHDEPSMQPGLPSAPLNWLWISASVGLRSSPASELASATVYQTFALAPAGRLAASKVKTSRGPDDPSTPPVASHSSGSNVALLTMVTLLFMYEPWMSAANRKTLSAC